MAAQIIDGKAVAAYRRSKLATRVRELAASDLVPGLAVVIVGEDPASEVYVRQKQLASDEIGIRSEKHELRATVSQEELLALIDKLNARDEVHGILVQLPLPEHIDASTVIERIDPAKDVDGFHPVNVGRLVVGQETFLPCTPQGVMMLLDEAGVALEGKEAVIVGRSNIVGKPLALMLLARHATVTVCHSRTRDLDRQISRADVLVAAVGRPEMVRGEWIKKGAVVIDVGVNRVDDKLVGDVEFETARQRAGAITPVPGGVGPMTIAMLMENAVLAAVRQAGRM